MPRTHNFEDNWTTFRDLLEQLLDTLETQTEIIKSMLKEGDHADHLDFVAIGISYEQLFDTTSAATLHSLSDEADEKTSMTKRYKPREHAPSDKYPNARKAWNDDEHDVLRAAVRLGMPFTFVAERLGRTADAVRQEAHKQGLQVIQRVGENPKAWTVDEVETLLQAVKAGFTYNQSAELLSRTYDSIRSQIGKLRRDGRL